MNNNGNNEIKVGDTVRSHDFPFHGKDESGERACYVEGIVTGFERIEGCERYVIEATRRVFGGKEVEAEEGPFYPPVNGTKSWLGGETDGVEKLTVCAMCGHAFKLDEDLHCWDEDYCSEECEDQDRAIMRADAARDAAKYGEL